MRHERSFCFPKGLKHLALVAKTFLIELVVEISRQQMKVDVVYFVLTLRKKRTKVLPHIATGCPKVGDNLCLICLHKRETIEHLERAKPNDLLDMPLRNNQKVARHEARITQCDKSKRSPFKYYCPLRVYETKRASHNSSFIALIRAQYASTRIAGDTPLSNFSFLSSPAPKDKPLANLNCRKVHETDAEEEEELGGPERHEREERAYRRKKERGEKERD